jgi:hypothetical protein
MFGKNHMLKLAGGIATAATIAVVAVPSALGAQDTWYGYAVSLTQSAHATPLITDTLGGNGHPKQTVQGYRFITDTLGGNGHARYNPAAYVYGGSSPAVAKAIQALGNGQNPAPSVSSSPSGTGFSWGDAGVGAGIAAGLMLLLLAGARLRTNNKRSVLAA